MSEENGERPTTRMIDAIEAARGATLRCGPGIAEVHKHLDAARKAAEAFDFQERVEANLRTLFDAVNGIERRLNGEAR